MLQKKDYQQQTIKIPVTPTIKNATKEGLPTTPTIKKSIVENQTSGKIKTNVTKEGLPTNNKDTSNTNNKRMLQNKDYQQQHQQ